MKRLLFIAFTVIFTQVYGAEWQESPELAKLFKDAEVTGTFALYDVRGDRLVGNNHDRAQERRIPASTFKIPNSLIGLETGAVKDVDEILPYGGEPQFIKEWEKDMSLRDAIPISNVPIYQELARRIGIEAMRKKVADLNYGNAEIGTVIDKFWLKGPLKISPIEQVQFLAKLAKDELPFKKEHQAVVREITLLESGEGWSLHGKTGWANAPQPGVGWWVGWVTKGEDVYAFALNIDINDPSDAGKRVELGKACLVALGVLEEK